MRLVGVRSTHSRVLYHMAQDRNLTTPKLCELRSLEDASRVRIDIADPYSLMFELMMEASACRLWYSDGLRGQCVNAMIDMTCRDCLMCIGIDTETLKRLREL